MITMQRLLKRIHILGTAWFVLCAGALLVLSLRQAGVSWWWVFSISSYSAVLFTFLLAFFLFAMFRGVVRAQCAMEHPLSTSLAYLVFYDAAPFFGAVAGLLGSIGVANGVTLVWMVIEGTLGMTFVTWVVVDSLVGGIESMLPQSIRQRSRRLEEAHAEKCRILQENATMLMTLEYREQDLKRDWEAAFRESVAELASLCSSGPEKIKQLQVCTVEAGAKAWKTGNISCMRFVHRMILEEMNRCPVGPCVDYAALWWDGIGSWRRPKELASAPTGFGAGKTHPI